MSKFDQLKALIPKAEFKSLDPSLFPLDKSTPYATHVASIEIEGETITVYRTNTGKEMIKDSDMKILFND